MAAVVGMGARREPARPVPGAIWKARVSDAATITSELSRLWARFDGERRTGPGGRGGEDDRERARPDGVQVRASTLNLTAVARSRADARRVEDAVGRLSELYPSRATILLADRERDHADATSALDVSAALLEQPGEKGRPAVRFECVTVEVAGSDERHLASIATPLLVVDLPDFLWWTADGMVGSGLFDDLIDVSDRLLVDSAAFTDPATELRFLATLLGRGLGRPRTSDFAWARTSAWRRAITQLFDPPAARAALDALDEVEIAYGAPGADGRSGLTAALLLAGWLGSRLGWQTPGELVPAGNAPGAWQATLRTGTRGRRREVTIALRPTATATAALGLGEVVLGAGGGAASFGVERVDALTLATRSEGVGAAIGRRLLHAPLPDDAALLTEELRVFGRDPVFEAALGLAADLAPVVEGGTA